MRLLRAQEAHAIDRLAAAEGLDEMMLIHRAGRRAAQIIAQLYPRGRVHLLCGSGNNGADGMVAARYLLDAGFDARVFLLGAAKHPQLWRGKSYALDLAQGARPHDKADLIIDALFGTGLSRPLAPDLAALAGSLTKPIIALDVPSGVQCDDGRVAARAFAAERTITFVRPHPCHFLLPARELCGEVMIADIGIPDHLLTRLSSSPAICLNEKPRWQPLPRAIHKYQRGAVLIVGGSLEKSGAARLAARAALRIGAGLVTLHLPSLYPIDDLSIMTECQPLEQSLNDPRRNVILIGPGNGVNAQTKHHALTALRHTIHVILDADALSCFAENPSQLFEAIRARREGAVILTPHAGEFHRIFPELENAAKIERAQQAAAKSGAIILLKGSDSIIASPQGEIIINANAPPELASAGSGDVLAGMIGGLIAQRCLPPFESAAAACYLHGQLGQMAGRSLIAEDLPDLIPRLIADLPRDADG